MGREKLYDILHQANHLLSSLENTDDKKSVLLNMLLLRKTTYDFELTRLNLWRQNPEFCEDPSQFKSRHAVYLPEHMQRQKACSLSDVKEFICSVLQALAKEFPALQEALWLEPEQIPVDAQTLLTLYQLFQSLPVCEQKLGSSDFSEMLEMVLQLYLPSDSLSAGFYTPRSVITLVVALLNPVRGSIYDPCCKNAATLIAAARRLSEQQAEYELFGQEENPNAWLLAQMALYASSIEADLGAASDDVFIHDLHAPLRADYVVANPPFHSRNWSRDSALLASDPRWKYGTPPKGNGDYAWLQHALSHAKDGGKVSVVLPVSSLYRENALESTIRSKIIQDDIIEAIVALPKGLFYGTQVMTAIWVLNKDKSSLCRNRILFIDASALGTKANRTVTLEEDTCQRILSTYKAYLGGEVVRQEGFCTAAALEEIAARDCTLFPKRYIPYAKEAVPTVSELEERRRQLQAELRHLVSENSLLLTRLLSGK